MRVTLKPVERSDLEWLLFQRNIPENYMMFNQPVPLSYDQQVYWYENQVMTQKAFAYMVFLDKLKIGYVALQNINWITRDAEVSHFIISDVNPNLTLYSHNLILHIAFQDLNLNKVHSICFNHNPVFEKLKALGFKSEGTVRQVCFKSGQYGDGQMISVLRSEWTKLEDFKG